MNIFTIQSLQSACTNIMSLSIENLEFGLTYHTIDLWVISATTLPKEILSESDPYVIVEIVGACKCKTQKLRTETINDNHSPEWNR